MEPDRRSRSSAQAPPAISRPPSRVPRTRRRRSPSNDNPRIIADRTGRDDVSHRIYSNASDINQGRFPENPGIDVQASTAPVMPEVYLPDSGRSQEEEPYAHFPSPRPPVADIYSAPVDRSPSLRPSILPDHQPHSFRTSTPPPPTIPQPTGSRTHRRHRSPSNDHRHMVDDRRGREDPSHRIRSNTSDINHDRFVGNAGVGVEAPVIPDTHFEDSRRSQRGEHTSTHFPSSRPPVAEGYPMPVHRSPSVNPPPGHPHHSFIPQPAQPSPTNYYGPQHAQFPPAHVDAPFNQPPLVPSPQHTFPLSHEPVIPPIQIQHPHVIATHFAFDSIPRQVYSTAAFLQIPTFYQTRVSRAFEDVEMSIPEIRGAMLDVTQQKLEANDLVGPRPPRPTSKSDAKKFKKLLEAWREFIETVVKEWETFNIISALLLSAILSILQMNVAVIPIIRYPALISLFCAFISLTFGSIYVSKFSEMKRASVAAEFALETKQKSYPILFNAWIMLAMPASWLAWSMVLFLVSITSLIWTTGASDSSTKALSSHKSFAPRLVTTLVLLVGFFYFIVIMITFSKYGGNLDQAWVRRLQETHHWDESVSRPQVGPSVDQEKSGGLSGRKALIRHHNH